jgi:hypothetical protein
MRKMVGKEESIEEGNKRMLMNQAIEVKHHAVELMEAISKNDKIDAWVVAKLERATTDLSDITHYLEGASQGYEKGGMMNTYDEGGEMEESDEVDLFEDYENIPDNVQEILEKYEEDFEEGNYKRLQEAQKELENIGYTFEFGLDGVAYNLRKMRYGGYMADGGMMAKGDNKYDEYEMVVVSKELEKDGGSFHKNRFLVSAKDINEAKNIATKLWEKEFGDSDLSIVKVMSDEIYRIKRLDAKYTRNRDYKYAVMNKYVIGFQGREHILYFKSEQEAKDYVKEKPSMREYLGIIYPNGGMADGGKVKFSDKVKSISMRLEGTKVPKNLEGDYGKRYNKLESKMAAQRIAGSMKKKGY